MKQKMVESNKRQYWQVTLLVNSNNETINEIINETTVLLISRLTVINSYMEYTVHTSLISITKFLEQGSYSSNVFKQ